MSNISRNIRNARIEVGLTQLQLAEKIGVAEAQIQHWESGRRNPGTGSLMKISKALNISLDDLVK